MVPCTSASFVARWLCLVLAVTGSSDEVGGSADSEGCAVEASSLELLQKEISLEQRETKAALKRSAQKQVSPPKMGSKAAALRDDRSLLGKRIEKPLMGIGHHMIPMIPEDNKDVQKHIFPEERIDSYPDLTARTLMARRIRTQLDSAALPAVASTGAIMAAVCAFLLVLVCCMWYSTGAEESDDTKAMDHGSTLLEGQHSPRSARTIAAVSFKALRSGASPEEAAAAAKAALARQQRQGERAQRRQACDPC